MPVDRRKGLQAAERLLKQGKLQAALNELQRVSESAPDDLLTLNRLGDLLARQGRNDEAIGYYRKIADQFAEGGFLPKSVAIQKKILRIDPHNLDSLVALGELYLTQNLHGEARNYLLHAASQHVEVKSFEQARKIYDRLIEAEPDELRHRIRLAETHAAEGNSVRAGQELVGLARALLDQGSTSEAERVFGRAAELVPDSYEPLLGSVDCLLADNRDEEALKRLEEKASGETPPPVLVGELACLYERMGRSEEALSLVTQTQFLEISHRSWLKLFKCYIEKDDVDTLWKNLDPLFAGLEMGQAEPLGVLLQRLDEVEERGHLPALERLYRLQQRRGDIAAEAAALESLVSAYRARSMSKEAARMAERLREIAPEPQAVSLPSEEPAVEMTPTAHRARPAPKAGPPGRPSADVPLEAEAPAVPLNRTDEEFVTGRLTQSEVLEKYGLKPQALEQVESVTSRFPGLVKAQELRVRLLRGTDGAEALAEGLAALALAQRAAGDNDGALEAAAEAGAGQLGDGSRRVLEQCRLIEDGEPKPDAVESPAVSIEVDSAPAPADTPFEVDAATPVAVALDASDASDLGSLTVDNPAESAIEHNAIAGVAATTAETTVARTAPSPIASGGSDVVIDFDALDAPTPEPEAPGPSEQPATTREPGADMLEEIEGFVATGALDEARRRIEALRTLGYAGPGLDAVADRIEAPAAAVVEAAVDPPAVTPVPASEFETVPEAEAEPAQTTDEAETDLSEIAAALEREMPDEAAPSEPIVPEEDPEQSIDEIFSSFKAAVQEQVSEEDHGTHYDLAIAYKEMGLIDEAIGGFELASSSPEYRRQACAMIGLCLWEREELEPAADWYRKAIEAALKDGEEVSHLQYELGEVLLQSGDREGALSEFRAVHLADPDYREVCERLSKLDEQLQT